MSRTKKSTLTNPYLRAYRILEKEFSMASCTAIYHGYTYDITWALVACRYAELFRPDGPWDEPWWLEGKFKTFKEKRQWRLTALCLAAAMRDTGNL